MSREILPDRRTVLSRREVAAGLLMLSGAAVALVRKPNIKIDYMGNQKLDDVIPAQIGRWKFVASSGLVVPTEDQTALTLYSQLMTRVYFDGSSPPIMLLVAYSANQTGFLQVHRPEFCYTAAGYSLTKAEPHMIHLGPSQAITANKLTAARNGVKEKLLYWTRVGDHIPLSWPQQRLTIAKDNLNRIIPDAALIRVSTTLSDDARAMATVDEFARAMIASVPESHKRVFVA